MIVWWLPCCALPQVLRAPLSAPSMGLWEALFAPGPGTVIKDMDVVGDHCVLVGRTRADELELIVIPLTQPDKSYRVEVSGFTSRRLLVSAPSSLVLLTSPLQLPPWACVVQTNHPGLADPHAEFEFLISSPVQPPVPYCLHLKEGLLVPGADNAPPPKVQHSSLPTRLEAPSQVRRLHVS